MLAELVRKSCLLYIHPFIYSFIDLLYYNGCACLFLTMKNKKNLYISRLCINYLVTGNYISITYLFFLLSKCVNTKLVAVLKQSTFLNSYARDRESFITKIIILSFKLLFYFSNQTLSRPEISCYL